MHLFFQLPRKEDKFRSQFGKKWDGDRREFGNTKGGREVRIMNFSLECITLSHDPAPIQHRHTSLLAARAPALPHHHASAGDVYHDDLQQISFIKSEIQFPLDPFFPPRVQKNTVSLPSWRTRALFPWLDFVEGGKGGEPGSFSSAKACLGIACRTNTLHRSP